jgi:hypothetical protein
VNVTLIVQLPPDGSEVPQPFVCVKSPEAVTPEIDSAPVPVFDSVTVCAGLAAPTSWLPKVSVGGVSETAGTSAIPVPDSPTVCGLPDALLDTDSAPSRTPAAVGVKVTLIVQLLPAGSVVVQLCVDAKSPDAVMLPIDSAPVPVLVSVTGCAGDVVPTLRAA